MYLGIDLGTSGLRALLITPEGASIGSADSAYDVDNPHPGWSEQSPASWTAALDEAVQRLSSAHPEFAQVKAIAVSGHMHGATLLDADNAVLRPCILWNDTRSAAEAAYLDSAPDVRGLSGNIAFPGFTAPKLMWVRRHEPEIFEKVAKVLLPAAYLNFHLTGRHVSDMSDSAGTSWLDVHERKWSEKLLRAGSMRLDQMPELVEGSEKAGVLRPELAEKWDLAKDVQIAGGAADNAAAACGMGVLRDGDGFVSLGTSGVVLAGRDRCAPAPETAVHTFCHAIPDQWYQMGVMLSATDCMNWLARITGQSPQNMSDALGDTLQAPGRETFLPYLSGERTPHNNADLRASLNDVGVETDVPAMTRAVMCGVAFGLRDCAEALKSTGARIETLYAIGGGARSRYWVQLLATVLQTPLATPSAGEYGAALGAARLAQAAHLGGDATAIMAPPEVSETIEPDPALATAYEDSYQRFKEMVGGLTRSS